MFSDAKKELERLEAELLAAEAAAEAVDWAETDWDEEALALEVEDWETDALIREIDSYVNQEPEPQPQPRPYCAYNADRTDLDPEEISAAIDEPGSDNRKLIILACVLMGGIALVVLWWIVRFFLL